MMKMKDLFKKFEDFRLLTDFSIDEEMIRRVTVIDAPDFDKFIQEGDLVLTTAYMIKDNVEDLKALILKLKKKQAVALGLKLNRFIKKIPPECLALANEIGLAVVFIPNAYAYADIINPVLTDILNEQLKEIQLTEKIHNEFTSLLIYNKTEDQILTHLYDILKKPFYFKDLYSQKEFSFVWALKEPFYFSENIPSCFFSKTIYGRHRKLGFFLMKVEEAQLSHIEKMAIIHAMDTLHIKIAQNMNIDLIKEKNRNDLIQDICIHNINTQEELHNRANIFHWNLQGIWNCVIFDIDHFKSNFYEQPFDSTDLERKKNDIYNFIIAALKDSGVEAHYFTKSDSIIFLIKLDNNGVQDILKKQKEEVIAPIIRALKKNTALTLTVGVGLPVTDIMFAYTSYNQAIEAIKISRILYIQDRISCYEEIKVYHYLVQAIKKDTLSKEMLQSLYQLQEFDKANRTSYLETLGGLVKNGWDIKKTAQALFMHYNTIRYRFERIFDLIGKNQSNPQDIFELELCYRVYEIYKSIYEKEDV